MQDTKINTFTFAAGIKCIKMVQRKKTKSWQLRQKSKLYAAFETRAIPMCCVVNYHSEKHFFVNFSSNFIKQYIMY